MELRLETRNVVGDFSKRVRAQGRNKICWRAGRL